MTTPGDPSHRHDQLHRGLVPTDQLADGTATSGYAPISNGDGTVTWAASGGGGSCDHQHTYDRFVASGSSPETFALSAEPIDGLVDVRVNGSSADPDDVSVTGSDVDVITAAADVVVIWYAKACEASSDTLGAIADVNLGDNGFTWYGMVWPPAPGTWAANHEYQPGSMVIDSNGHTQVRYPNYPGKSGASEPTWDTGGSYTTDEDGYWHDLGIGPDFDALTFTWSAADELTAVDAVVFVQPSVPDGRHFCGVGDAGVETGAVEPDWDTMAIGDETFCLGYATGIDALVTSRPFTTGTVTVEQNGTPITEGVDWDEVDPTQGWITITAFVFGDDTFHVVYTPA